MIAFNFRPDRMRQIVAALADPGFDGFDRGDAPAARRDDDDRLPRRAGCFPVAFPALAPGDDPGRGDRRGGRGQLHVAETEKYAHVTYFFNGGARRSRSGEERGWWSRPRDVATYDHSPR